MEPLHWPLFPLWTLLPLIGLIGILLITQVRSFFDSSANSSSRFSSHSAPASFTIPPLSTWQVVDLTHPLTPTIPIWSGDPAVEILPWASYDQDGYFIHRVTLGEHSGTHWGTPNTFIAGATSAAQVPADQLVAPAVVIDIRDRADPDYRLSITDIQTWEAQNGPIPASSHVLLYTGWQARWPDPIAFLNLDQQGIPHWPGFSAEAAEFLISKRQATGLGTDTHGVDPGNDTVYGASTAIYTANGIVLECLSGLDQLPPTGATLIIGGLPIQNGSGSPARILALLPPAPAHPYPYPYP